jgi:hypothetical protein
LINVNLRLSTRSLTIQFAGRRVALGSVNHPPRQRAADNG